jgi:hypothetical protein
MQRGSKAPHEDKQPLLWGGGAGELDFAEGVRKTVGVRDTAGPQSSGALTRPASMAPGSTMVVGQRHDLTWLQKTFGHTDAWCQPLWWPVQPRHVPHEGFWWWTIVLLAFTVGPVVIGLRFTLESYPPVARELVDAGILVWLLLVGIIVMDTLKAIHPENGCAARLRNSMQRVGVTPAKCGSPVIYCRLVCCVLRVSLVLYGIGWGLGAYFSGVRLGFLLPIAIGEVVAGLVVVPFLGAWMTCLFLCVDLISASIQHIVDVRMKRLSDLSPAEFDAVDDATWKREVTEPIRTLLREQLPALSCFGFSIGCFCVISLAATLMTIPDTVNAFAGRSRDKAQAVLLAVAMGVYLFVPIMILVLPVHISTLAGQRMAMAVHEMRPGGAGIQYDRVAALKDYLSGSNYGQGPGFVVFGTVATKAQLMTAATSLSVLYPFVLFMVDEFT